MVSIVSGNLAPDIRGHHTHRPGAPPRLDGRLAPRVVGDEWVGATASNTKPHATCRVAAGWVILNRLRGTITRHETNASTCKEEALSYRPGVHDLDPFSTEFLTDPYPRYEMLRAAGPLVRMERNDMWVAARYSSVSAILRDPETFCSSAGIGLSNFHTEASWRRRSPLSEVDPPEHSRIRAVVAPLLSSGGLSRLIRWYRAAAETMVEQLAHSDPFDAMTELANAYPQRMFTEVFGLPPEHGGSIVRACRIKWNPGSRDGSGETVTEPVEPDLEWTLEHCGPRAFRPGRMGADLHERAAAAGLTETESAFLVRTLLSAGVDTTAHALGNTLWCLATNPDQYELLRADPSRARTVFEEVLRYESPSPVFFRTTTRAIEVGDVAVPDNTKIMLLLGAANRDTRRWPNPEHFDVTRRHMPHLAFATGIHTCLGMVLARIEGVALLEALAQRVSAIELTDTPQRMIHKTLRGFDRLPVRLVPT